MPDQPVSRGEFTMLQQVVADNARRLDGIDTGGTRGTVAQVGIVQVQLTDLAKEVAKLGGRMDAHEKEHEADAKDRRTSRRWAVMAVLGLVAAVDGPLIYLIQGH